MKLFILFISLFIITVSCYVPGQVEKSPDNRVLAEAGDLKITAQEFIDRYEFSPHPRSTESLDMSLVKKEYLYTLIAEKLLAQKARSLMLDTAKDVQGYSDYMEKLFVKDALYKKEISANVKITPEKIEEAKWRVSNVLLMKYLYSEEKSEIVKLYSELKQGTPLDTLLKGRPEEAEQKTLGKIIFGSLDKFVEDSLYNLKVGQFTKPLYTCNRWYIFKLYNKVTQPFFSTPAQLARINKTIKDREASTLEDDYLYNLLHKLRINVDRSLFMKIVKVLQGYLHAQEAIYKNKKRPKFIYMADNDFNNIEDSLGTDILNSVFIKYDKNPETVGEFLTQMKYNGFKVISTDRRTVTLIFNKYVKDYIQAEILERQGYKLKLQNSPSVKNDIGLWENYYIALKLERMIKDSISVSDAEAYEYYSKKNDALFPPEQVDIQEILVEDLDKVLKVLDDLDKKIPFGEVSKKYSILDTLRLNEGELGFLSITKHNKITEVARKMKVGEVYGPVKVPDGYAVIKLNGRKKGNEDRDTSFTNMKEDLKEIVKGIKFKKKLEEYVSDLGIKYRIKINQDVFNSVQVTRINTVTIRMIGFGGKIYAFPYEPLFGGWYKLYLKKKSVLNQ